MSKLSKEVGSCYWFAKVVMDAINDSMDEAGVDETDERLIQGLVLVTGSLLRSAQREDLVPLLAPLSMNLGERV